MQLEIVKKKSNYKRYHNKHEDVYNKIKDEKRTQKVKYIL